MYLVNGASFESFMAAVAAARPLRASVVEAATGIVRWSPAPQNAKRVRHVLVSADGSAEEFSKVRR